MASIETLDNDFVLSNFSPVFPNKLGSVDFANHFVSYVKKGLQYWSLQQQQQQSGSSTDCPRTFTRGIQWSATPPNKVIFNLLFYFVLTSLSSTIYIYSKKKFRYLSVC